ncbi:MAG: tripartite tricarboxylate transporter TctB family protein [Bacillota bacterium]
MRNKNIVIALVLLAFSLFAWLEVKDLPDISNIFPKVCIFFIVVLSILLIAQSLLNMTPNFIVEKKNLRYVKMLAAGIAGYVLTIIILGFNISSTLFLGIYGYLFDPVRTKKSLLQSFSIGVFATAVFYIVFGIIFNVPLPEGRLFE